MNSLMAASPAYSKSASSLKSNGTITLLVRLIGSASWLFESDYSRSEFTVYLAADRISPEGSLHSSELSSS